MKERNSEIKSSFEKKRAANGDVWQKIAVLFALCILLTIVSLGIFGQQTAKSFVYANEVYADEGSDITETTTDGTDIAEASLDKTPLNSDWDFEDKIPTLQNVPADATISYAVHDDDGAIVQASEIVDNGKYSVTATLSTVSAKNYYFADTGTDSVSIFFVYSKKATTLANKGLADIFPIWALLIIFLAVVGFILAIAKTFSNIHENVKEVKGKRAQRRNATTYSFAGGALLALFGLGVEMWMLLAFIAVALFFVAVLLMLITWKHREPVAVAQQTANTPAQTHIYVTNSYNYHAPVAAAVAVADDEEEDDEDDAEEIEGIQELKLIEGAGLKRKRTPSNFRVRLKAGSDKCKDFYTQLKNYICNYRNVTFRMRGRTEKVIYKGEVLAFIGTTKRSLKLWLALDPQDYNEEVYHHKDVSDKKIYEAVPMLVRIGSGKALARAKDLMNILLEKHAVETKKRYVDRDLQLLAYTLGRNALVKDKRADLLRMSIHAHDTADVLTNADAERYTEIKYRPPIEEKNFATVNLDVLDSKFLDGQRVTLDKLKKTELVPADCNGIRITGGTRLTKPLYVIADDYSAEAVKMIVLTGGRAVKLIEETK